jgi:hypothetical protein
MADVDRERMRSSASAVLSGMAPLQIATGFLTIFTRYYSLPQ